jgi:hypothetical protein
MIDQADASIFREALINSKSDVRLCRKPLIFMMEHFSDLN